MEKFIKWHKEFANKFMKKTGMDSYQLAWFSWAKGFIMGIVLMMLLSNCGATYYHVGTGTKMNKKCGKR